MSRYYMGDRFEYGNEEFILAFTVGFKNKNEHYFQLINTKTGNRFSDTVIRYTAGDNISITEEEMMAICEGDFYNMIYKPTGERS